MPWTSNIVTRRLVFGLWLNWALAFGAIALVFVMPFIMSKLWQPVAVIVLAYLLLAYSNRESERHPTGCELTLRVSVLTLFWSAMVMFVINILNSRMMFDGAIDWSTSNRDIPFVTGLIVFPVMLIICVWLKLMGHRTGFCRKCRARNGYAPGSSVVSTLYSHESTYQISLLLCIALVLAAVQWWYYFRYYINVNMNTPDRFFFNIMPIAIYVISLYFMWMRYTNLAMVIGPMWANPDQQKSLVRYIVLSGDRMKLKPNSKDRLDTPARAEVPAAKILTEDDARQEFEKLSGCEEFQLKFLYTSKMPNMHSDILHYVAMLGADCESVCRLDGEWYTLDQIDRLMKEARLAAELSDEIHRIFTVTMAWKTYDRQGRRLYPIKHYRPTFRLRDFMDWDVDYSDVGWLRVAANNQDRPFYRMRRLWEQFTGWLDR